jgi:hypothetical protein
MLQRVQELRIHPSQAGQVLGIDLIGFLLVGVDEPEFAGVGHQDLVATPFQEPANPGRVGSRFYGDAQGPLRGEASPEGFGGGAQPTLLDDLAALLVDEAEVGILVAEIQSGCRAWFVPATIHGGPILLSGRQSPYSLCRSSERVLRMGGRPSHLIFVEHPSLLKKSLSDQSVVRNTQDPRPKHYKTVNLNP